ncbi:hypothetical protein ACVWZZ_004416 [Bradyrhizobium sp. LM6.10]
MSLISEAIRGLKLLKLYKKAKAKRLELPPALGGRRKHNYVCA